MTPELLQEFKVKMGKDFFYWPRQARPGQGNWFSQHCMCPVFSYEGGSVQVDAKDKSELYLHYIQVYPEFRRKGEGTRMAKTVIKMVKEMGFVKATLEIGWLDPNNKTDPKVLKAWYKKMGFVPVKGERKKMEMKL
jgi:GNAT superfamily N-acetyltransferase